MPDQCIDNRTHRFTRIVAMQPVQIDRIDPEPLKAAVQIGGKMIRRYAQRKIAGAIIEFATLGRDHIIAALFLRQQFAERGFAGTGWNIRNPVAVRIRGIDEIAAIGEIHIENFSRSFFVQGSTEHIGAETQLRNVEFRFVKRDFFQHNLTPHLRSIAAWSIDVINEKCDTHRVRIALRTTAIAKQLLFAALLLDEIVEYLIQIFAILDRHRRMARQH